MLKLGYLNYVALTGYVVADPDLCYTASGKAVMNFRIGVNRAYRSNDEWKTDSYFFTITVWGNQAERLGEMLHKGTAVLIEGSLKQRSWTTNDEQKRSVVEVNARRVQVLDKTEREEQEQAEQSQNDSLDNIPF